MIIARYSDGMQRAWFRGIAAGLAALGAFATVFSLWWDAQGQNAQWVFWTGMSVFGVIVVGYPATAAVIRLKDFMKKGARFDELQRRISSLEGAAGGWQQRAENAEARLEHWDAETLLRGRSRAVGEMAATAAATGFGDTELVRVPPNDEIAIFAKVTSGALPLPGAVFFLEGRVAHNVKAIVRCARHHDSDTVVFEIEEYVSLTHEDLLPADRTIGALPPSLVIAHRSRDDDFSNERR